MEPLRVQADEFEHVVAYLEDFFEIKLSETDKGTLKSLMEAQEKMTDMNALPKVADFCECASVKCNLQDPSYLVKKLKLENEVLNMNPQELKTEHLKWKSDQ